MQGLSIIVKKVAQLMGPLIFVYGTYIVTHGHLTPGGGFAGGAVIAGAFILLILAFGARFVALKKEKESSSLTESLAILIVLCIAVAGLFLGSMVFFNNFLPRGVAGMLLSSGVIPLYNIFIGIEVAAALTTIFLVLVIYKEEVSS